jgi:hypothetical protein
MEKSLAWRPMVVAFYLNGYMYLSQLHQVEEEEEREEEIEIEGGMYPPSSGLAFSLFYPRDEKWKKRDRNVRSREEVWRAG